MPVSYVQEANASAQDQEIASHLVGKEKAALEKWFQGDVSGYASLWSKNSFSYIG